MPFLVQDSACPTSELAESRTGIHRVGFLFSECQSVEYSEASGGRARALGSLKVLPARLMKPAEMNILLLPGQSRLDEKFSSRSVLMLSV